MQNNSRATIDETLMDQKSKEISSSLDYKKYIDNVFNITKN